MSHCDYFRAEWFQSDPDLLEDEVLYFDGSYLFIVKLEKTEPDVIQHGKNENQI